MSKILRRSKYVSLPPLNTGTSSVECLTSYFARLAEAHSVKLNDLLRFSLVDYFGDRSRVMKELLRDNDYRRSFNGLSSVTAEWASLSDLLGVPLRQLTLLELSNLLPLSRLLSRHKKWCPLCYSKDLIKYDRLIWMLELIKVCPEHRIILHSQCPACLKKQYPCPPNNEPGYCCYCGHELISSDKIEYADQEIDLRVVREVGSILENTSAGLLPVGLDQFHNNIRYYFMKRAIKNRHLKSSINHWRNGLFRPSLRNLLKFSVDFDLHLKPLFYSSNDNVPLVVNRRIPSHSSGRKTQDHKKIEKALKKELTSPKIRSINQLSKDLHCAKKTIIYKFPELSQRIVTRGNTERRKSEARRKRKLKNDINNAVKEALKELTGPTHRNIANNINTPGCFREKFARCCERNAVKRYLKAG